MSLCLQIKDPLLGLRLNILFSLESGSLYAGLLLVVTSMYNRDQTTAADLAYFITYPVCILSAVSSSSAKVQVYWIAEESHQGLLPTLMHVYVGLDLGVKNEEITNSYARRLKLKTQREGSGVPEIQEGG